MNRIVIVAFAAVLLHLTLACAAEPSAPPRDESAETASATIDEAEEDAFDPYAVVPASDLEARKEWIVDPYAIDFVRKPELDERFVASK